MMPTAVFDRTACRLAAALLGVAGALCACSSSPPIRYYALAPVAAAADSANRAAYAGPVVEVGSVQLPPDVARTEMVRATAAGRFEIREFDHWAAPLGRLARQTLTENLASRLPDGKVVFPGASWPTAESVLDVDILSFSVADGRGRMLLSWSLRSRVAPTASAASAVRSGNGAPRGAQLRLEVPAEEGAEATARAWSDLLAQLSDRVAAELAGRPAP